MSLPPAYKISPTGSMKTVVDLIDATVEFCGKGKNKHLRYVSKIIDVRKVFNDVHVCVRDPNSDALGGMWIKYDRVLRFVEK